MAYYPPTDRELKDFFREHADAVCRSCGFLTCGKADTQRMVKDVFLKLLKNYKENQKYKGFYGILCHNHHSAHTCADKSTDYGNKGSNTYKRTDHGSIGYSQNKHTYHTKTA